MVVRRAQCPAGPAPQPKMSSTFAPEGESLPTSSDVEVAWTTQVPRSSVASDEIVIGQSNCIDPQILSTLGIPANSMTQEYGTPFNFSESLESDLIPGPGAHDNTRQSGNLSNIPAQPQHGSSLMSTAFEPFPEPLIPRDEQPELGSHNMEGDFCPEHYPEDCLDASLEDVGTLPQPMQNSLTAPFSLPTTELFSSPEPICSACFQLLHLCPFFACHQRTKLPPNGTCWNKTGGVPWNLPTIACHINLIGSGMCDEGVSSDSATATPSRYPTMNLEAGSDAMAGNSGPVEGRQQDPERFYREMPMPDHEQSPTNMGFANSFATSPAMTSSTNTPCTSFSESEDSPTSSDARQLWQCDRCDQGFHQKCRLKRHVSSVHIRPHKCPHCSTQGFGLPKDLKRHLRTQHPQIYRANTYRCLHGGCAIFNQPKFRGRLDNYQKHMRTHRANATTPEASSSSFASSPSTT